MKWETVIQKGGHVERECDVRSCDGGVSREEAVCKQHSRGT